MRLVVADTNILFPGLIVPRSIYRKLLVVFAYGKLHADVLAAEAYKAEIEQLLVEEAGAELGGQPSPDQVIDAAKSKLASLEEHLPPGTPNEYGLALSSPLTTEIYDNATGERSVIGNQPREIAEAAVAAALSVSATQVVKGLDGPVPAYTEGRDESDDPIIHTAILANAELVLSQDHRHITLHRRRPTTYTEPTSGRSVDAVGLWYFINRVLCSGLHFDGDDLKTIDGEEAFRVALRSVGAPAP